MTIATGQLVAGRYEILAPIHAGGMGAVYRAADRHFKNRTVALKQMLEDVSFGDDKDLIHEKFEAEAEMLLSLHHAGIPRVVDHFKQGDSHFVVMEFIHGDSLDKQLEQSLALAQQPLAPLQVVGIAIEVCEVLQYLHSRVPPVIHRDIKPGNLIVRYSDNRVFLVDFGLARPLNTDSLQPKTLVGTLGYAPLEQVSGHPEIRSDVYGLGATMYHLMTGKMPAPFDIPPLEEALPEVLPQLAHIVTTSTQQSPEMRYGSIDEMLDDLRAVLRLLEPSSIDTVEMVPPTQPPATEPSPYDTLEVERQAPPQTVVFTVPPRPMAPPVTVAELASRRTRRRAQLVAWVAGAALGSALLTRLLVTSQAAPDNAAPPPASPSVRVVQVQTQPVGDNADLVVPDARDGSLYWDGWKATPADAMGEDNDGLQVHVPATGATLQSPLVKMGAQRTYDVHLQLTMDEGRRVSVSVVDRDHRVLVPPVSQQVEPSRLWAPHDFTFTAPAAGALAIHLDGPAGLVRLSNVEVNEDQTQH